MTAAEMSSGSATVDGMGVSLKNQRPTTSPEQVSEDKNKLRDQLLVESQEDVARLTRENQKLKVELHKLKQRAKWQDDRLKYFGDAGSRRKKSEIELYKADNQKLARKIDELHFALDVERGKREALESGENLNSWIRENRYPIVMSIESKKKLLEHSLQEIMLKEKERVAREAALGPVYDAKRRLARTKPTVHEKRVIDIQETLQFYTSIQEYISAIMRSYHALVLKQEKEMAALEKEKQQRIGKINSLTRLAHVRKHGVLLGFQEAMKESKLSQHSLSHSSILSTGSLTTTSFAEDSTARWAKCTRCSMYNSSKATACAHCQCETFKMIEIPPPAEI